MTLNGIPRDCPKFLSTGTSKATDFIFGRYIRRVHLNKSQLKILNKRERGHIQGLPKVFRYLLLPQERESYRLQIWPVYSEGPSEQKPIKSFGEKGAWAYPATAQSF